MARRRRNNGTWFPTIGTHPAEADSLAGIAFALALPVGTNNLTGVLPLTFDYPQEGDTLDTATDVLSEIVGSEYICNRVVGKMFACYNADEGGLPVLESASNPAQAILFGAGLFVSRADDVDSGPNGANSPIGLLSAIDDNYGVFKGSTIREPWMWRRVWMLGNNQGMFEAPVGTWKNWNGFTRFPSTTAGYGSVMDGPHVDCKSKRRIKQDERLWLALSIRRFPLGGSNPTFEESVEGYFDYRILGKLVKARNSSAF